ncbi:MAG: acyl dehydratase [Alphaproteobacteria bacterium]|nr:acyl dehydratase [Alphaproteobacteria bacterium]
MKTQTPQTRRDLLDPARAAALHATLALSGPTPGPGDALPPFWHYLYFWGVEPPENLGRDGHPMPGGFIPDTGLPRRMWAGGALEFLCPVTLGQSAERTSKIANVSRKTGRTGPLALVTLHHEIHQRGKLCIREVQNLIYREDPKPDAPKPAPKPAPRNEDHSQTATFNPTLLFRYSALTFNGHRIHYDRDYCRKVEGYPGLVVHGPLLAQHLIHLAIDRNGPIKTFTFRAMAPLFDFEKAVLCARDNGHELTLWIRGPDGRLIMEASAA